MLRAVLPILVLGLTALAGCGSPSNKPPTSDCELEPVLCDPEHYLATHHCIANDIRPRIYAPDTPGPDTPAAPWVQGAYWTYRLTVGSSSQSSTLVYYDDADFINGQPAHYLVGTSTRAEALDHAFYSTNPMLGRIHRSLYSPHERGVHADMFHFPLCAGSTWTTNFYGKTFDLTATPQTIPIPSGQDPLGFSITGTANDGASLRLFYSPQVKWFSDLELHRTDGPDVRMLLEATGTGRTGRYEFLRAQQDEIVDLAKVAADGTTVTRENGGEGPYDSIGLLLEARRSTGNGKVEVHVRDPAGTSRACVGFAGSGLTGTTTCPAGPLKIEVPYVEGDWKITVEKGLLDSATQVQGEALLVSLYDRGGNV